MTNGGVVFRMSDPTHYWWAGYWVDTLYLVRVNGTTATTVAAVGLGRPPAIVRLEVVLSGSTIDVWCNGTRQIHVSDWFNAYATRHGLQSNPSADPGSRFDLFEVDGTLAPAVDHVTVTPAQATLTVDQGGTLSADAWDSSATAVPGARVLFYSSDQRVLTVTPTSDRQATLTALNVGTSVVTAYAVRGPATPVSTAISVTSCVDPLSLSSLSAPSDATTMMLTVAAARACDWHARSDATWITITDGASGTGTRDIAFTIDHNPNGSPRVGTLWLGGQLLTVTQAEVRRAPAATVRLQYLA